MPMVQAPQRRFTVDEFYRIEEMLPPDESVELMDGYIILMGPESDPHWMTITRLVKLFRVFDDTHYTAPHAPYLIGTYFEPKPDLRLLPNDAMKDRKVARSTADLIVEVSVTSLSYDRKEKTSAYAMAGVTDYWIINLVERRVEVYRNPIESKSAIFGYAFGRMQIYNPGESVSPLVKPEASFTVDDLIRAAEG
jgi:Uma2 family endonuclease